MATLARTNTLVYDTAEGSPRASTMAQTVAEGEAWLHKNGSLDAMETESTGAAPARTSTMDQTVAEAQAWLSQSPPASPQHSGRSSSVQPPTIRSSDAEVKTASRSASASRRPSTSPSRRTARMSTTVEEGKQWLHKSGLGRANTMERTIAESKKWLSR